MGPTAAGKTALAYELASKFPIEIISVDSAMVYKDFDIGTAKPSKSELKAIPHHLIDILNPMDAYCAASFCEDTNKIISSIRKRHKIPFLVGGTMMYFHVLQNGLSPLPPANIDIRKEISDEANLFGWPFLHSKIKEIDQLAANKINQNDQQRIQRALEIYKLTGHPPSSFWTASPPNYKFINLILFPNERPWLHKKIAQRANAMFEQGWVDEVIKLMNKWQLTAASPAMRTVGYSQIADYLQGKDNFATMQKKAEAATRQLAKRQITWLRKSWQNAYYFQCDKFNFTNQAITIISNLIT